MNSNRGNPDDPTRHFRRDLGNGGFGGDDNEATQYISRAADSGYNPDADFAGGRGSSAVSGRSGMYRGMSDGAETRFETRYDASAGNGAGAGSRRFGPEGAAGGTKHQNAATPTGQYWAPLSDEERGYSRTSGYGDGRGYQQTAYGSSGSGSDPRGDWSGQEDKGSRGMSGTVKAIAITAVVAIVALVVILISYLTTSGGSDSAKQTSEPTTSSSTTSTTSTTPSTSSSTTPPSLNDAQKRLEEEMQRLQDNPPAIPGFGDVTSGYGSIPANLVGQSPLTAEAELRLNGFQNITVYDSEGNITNSAAAVMGKVSTVDPAPGSEIETSTPVNIYLE